MPYQDYFTTSSHGRTAPLRLCCGQAPTSQDNYHQHTPRQSLRRTLQALLLPNLIGKDAIVKRVSQRPKITATDRAPGDLDPLPYPTVSNTVPIDTATATKAKENRARKNVKPSATALGQTHIKHKKSRGLHQAAYGIQSPGPVSESTRQLACHTRVETVFDAALARTKTKTLLRAPTPSICYIVPLLCRHKRTTSHHDTGIAL